MIGTNAIMRGCVVHMNQVCSLKVIYKYQNYLYLLFLPLMEGIRINVNGHKYLPHTVMKMCTILDTMFWVFISFIVNHIQSIYYSDCNVLYVGIPDYLSLK